MRLLNCSTKDVRMLDSRFFWQQIVRQKMSACRIADFSDNKFWQIPIFLTTNSLTSRFFDSNDSFLRHLIWLIKIFVKICSSFLYLTFFNSYLILFNSYLIEWIFQAWICLIVGEATHLWQKYWQSFHFGGETAY